MESEKHTHKSNKDELDTVVIGSSSDSDSGLDSQPYTLLLIPPLRVVVKYLQSGIPNH